MSMADALGVAWYAKFNYHFWRPITAIRLADTDGNDATGADPMWTPLIVTPPYPDSVSGFNTITSSMTRALTHVLGTSRIDLYITSPATMTTRHYEWASQLTSDAINGRVWSGIHFRTADLDAYRMGPQGRGLRPRPLLRTSPPRRLTRTTFSELGAGHASRPALGSLTFRSERPAAAPDRARTVSTPRLARRPDVRAWGSARGWASGSAWVTASGSIAARPWVPRRRRAADRLPGSARSPRTGPRPGRLADRRGTA